MPLDPSLQQALIERYRARFREHHDSPEGVQYTDGEGQRFRFEQLIRVAPLAGRKILDVGCGLGHLYPFLQQEFGPLDYTGVDIVPETVAHAAKKFPDGRFICRDLLQAPLAERFDYVLICGVFNNTMPDATEFLKELVAVAFDHCTAGLAFNFISTSVNYRDADLAYHDPLDVLAFCLERLTPRVMMHHHYARCDVSVFAYR